MNDSHDTFIYLTGGRDVDGVVSKKVFKFSASNGTLTECTPMIKARENHAAVGSAGRLFVAGGVDEHGSVLKSCLKFDIL